MSKYIAKTVIEHDGKLYAIGKPLPELTEDQTADLLALGAIEEAPEDKARSKGKKPEGTE